MSRSEYSKGATIPVLFAIVSTIAVCGLCLAAYNKFVGEPKASAAKEQVSCVATEPDARAGLKKHRADNRKKDALKTAALINRLVKARGEKNDREEEVDDDMAMLINEENAYRASEEENAARSQAEMNTMDEQLDDEPVDREWAAETEKAAEEAFANLEDTLELEEVTCHKTFCRAEMTHFDPGTRKGDIDRLIATPALEHQMTSYVLPDDEKTTVMYFAREGHTLSVLNPDYSPSTPMPKGVDGHFGP